MYVPSYSCCIRTYDTIYTNNVLFCRMYIVWFQTQLDTAWFRPTWPMAFPSRHGSF